MKILIFAGLLFCSNYGNCQNVDISVYVEGVTEAWKDQDIAALRSHLENWGEITPDDPALCYSMIFYHMALVPDKIEAIQACDKLKFIGTECKSQELIELGEEKGAQILATPDNEFVPHPNEQLVALMALAPEGPPFVAIALTLKKYRKDIAE